MRAAWLAIALAVLALSGCSPRPASPAVGAEVAQPDPSPASAPRPAPQDVAPATAPAAPASTAAHAPASPAPARADKVVGADAPSLACRTDADCAVKDVGSCCGYRPACVNADAQTFPERVKQQCADDGRMGMCGFPAIQGCQCVSGQCAAIRAGPADPAPLQ